MPSLNTYGSFIRGYRRSHGIDITGFAKTLGVSLSAVSDYEIGRCEIPSSFVDSVVSLYHMTDEEKTELQAAVLKSQRELYPLSDELKYESMAGCSFSRTLTEKQLERGLKSEWSESRRLRDKIQGVM